MTYALYYEGSVVVLKYLVNISFPFYFTSAHEPEGLYLELLRYDFKQHRNIRGASHLNNLARTWTIYKNLHWKWRLKLDVNNISLADTFERNKYIGVIGHSDSPEAQNSPTKRVVFWHVFRRASWFRGC